MEAEQCLPVKNAQKVEINNLQLGQKYLFRVATEDLEGNLSEWVTTSVFTGNIKHAVTFHVSFTAVYLHSTA